MFASIEDRFQNAIDVFVNVIVPEAYNRPAFSFYKCVACSVAGSVVGPMLIAVQFNDNARFNACEISYVGADCMLTPKTKTAQLFAAKTSPELLFRRRHFFTKAFCSRVRFTDRHTI